MQKISLRSNELALVAPLAEIQWRCAASLLAYTWAAALLAGLAPVTIKVAIVFLFAGPHNWVEFRYMLSRLPARWKNSRSFFLLSFSGVTLLSLSFIAIMGALYLTVTSVDQLRTLFSIWGSAFILWLCALVHNRRLIKAQPVRLVFYAFCLLTIFSCWSAPEWFSLALVYVHPLIALVILDFELRRSRRHLVSTYRLVLLTAPLLLLCFWLQPGVVLPAGAATKLVIEQAGVAMLSPLPPHFVLSTLVFFDLLHYGVWLFAIPAYSLSWHKLGPRAIPIACRSELAGRSVARLFALSSIAVVTLWLCFAANFNFTYSLYFVIAVVHVLAEMPFLIWIAACKSQ